eukprot:365023-Chlamydomonas_euryale.AAC.6
MRLRPPEHPTVGTLHVAGCNGRIAAGRVQWARVVGGAAAGIAAAAASPSETALVASGAYHQPFRQTIIIAYI